MPERGEHARNIILTFYALTKDVPTKPRKEESVLGMEQSAQRAIMKGAPTLPCKGESVRDMEQM